MKPETRGTGAGFQPLASLLAVQAPEKLEAVRSKLEGVGRDELIVLSRNSFDQGKRIVFYLVGDALTKRGIPPCFRLDHHAPPPTTIEQRFDLLLADLRWLRREYPNHSKAVRYRRCKVLLTGSDRLFHAEAEYAFWQGKRPAWRIVQSLSLTECQQLDCVWLRSAPIKKRDAATQAMRDMVFKALQDDLRAVRRTSAFSDDDAYASLIRRHALWLCARMTDGGPTETARRFRQLTGEGITRQTCQKQLGKIHVALKKNGLATR